MQRTNESKAIIKSHVNYIKILIFLHNCKARLVHMVTIMLQV